MGGVISPRAQESSNFVRLLATFRLCGPGRMLQTRDSATGQESMLKLEKLMTVKLSTVAKRHFLEE